MRDPALCLAEMDPDILAALDAAGPPPRRRDGEALDDFVARNVAWIMPVPGLPTPVVLQRSLIAQKARETGAALDVALPSLWRSGTKCEALN